MPNDLDFESTFFLQSAFIPLCSNSFLYTHCRENVYEAAIVAVTLQQIIYSLNDRAFQMKLWDLADEHDDIEYDSFSVSVICRALK